MVGNLPLLAMDTFALVIYWIFLLATLTNIGYWVLLFSKLAFYKNEEGLSLKNNATKSDPPLVSILICARNEAENLKKNLHRFLNQTYRSIEIIVVDDGSTDKTWEVLQNFQKRNPTFRIIIIFNKIKLYTGKKEALLKGVEAASGNIILLTDADCTPKTNEWVNEMVKTIDEKHEIGLGYSPYKTKKGFLNRFIRFETVYTAIQYFSFALAGIPYMGVGRNLIYKKKLIERVNGFHEHIQLASGDDDLFVNAVATSTNTKVQLDKSSFVLSEPASSWTAYYRQKSRHMTTGKFYRPIHQVMLGHLALSHFLHYMGGFVLLYIKISTIFVFLLYVMRMLVVMILFAQIARKLQDRSLTYWFPIFDFLFIFYYLIFLPYFFKRKTQPWK